MLILCPSLHLPPTLIYLPIFHLLMCHLCFLIFAGSWFIF